MPADLRFWGIVYQGPFGDTHTPLSNVQVALLGRLYSGEEHLLATYKTTAAGWFGFHTYADFPMYVLKVSIQNNWVVTGAWSDNAEALIEDNNAIVYPHPPNGTYARNFFFLVSSTDPVQSASPTHLVIQEVQFDPPASGRLNGDYEWVDIYNPTAASVRLQGWHLYDASGARDPLPDITLQSGEFLTIVADQEAFKAMYPTYSGKLFEVPDGRLGNGLANRGDALFLRSDLEITVDEVSWGQNQEAFSPAVPIGARGTSIERLPAEKDTDSAQDWIIQHQPAPGAIGDIPTATPTATFTPTPTRTSTPTPSPRETPTPQATSTPTDTATDTPTPVPTSTPSSTPIPTFSPTPTPTWTPTSTITPTPTRFYTPSFTPPPTVLINEFLPAPGGAVDWDGNGVADSKDEWIELFNPNPFPVDLSGWWLDDTDGGTSPWTIPAQTSIKPHGYLVFYQRQTQIVLNNSGDDVRLLASNGQEVDRVHYLSTHPTDTRSWGRIPDGDTKWTSNLVPSPGEKNVLASPTVTPAPTVVAPPVVTPTPPVPSQPSSHSPRTPSTLRVESLELLKRIPLGTYVEIFGIVTLPPGWIGTRVFYIGDRTGGIRVYVPKSVGDIRKLHLTIYTEVRLRGRLEYHKGEPEIIVNTMDAITSRIVAHPLSPMPYRPGTAPPFGSLIKADGQVVRIYKRSFLLDAGERALLVYAPKRANFSVEGLRRGQRYQVTGVVTRWKKGRELVLRGPQDVMSIKPRLSFFCNYGICWIRESEDAHTPLCSYLPACILVDKRKVFII